MAELTTAVDDKELVSHFIGVIAPYCLTRKVTLPAVPTSHQTRLTESEFVGRIEESLVAMVNNSDSKTVCNIRILKR